MQIFWLGKKKHLKEKNTHFLLSNLQNKRENTFRIFFKTYNIFGCIYIKLFFYVSVRNAVF